MTERRTFLSGFSWHGASSAISMLVQWSLWLILARMVAPEEVGLLAMAFVWIRIISPLMDLGITHTVIQGPEEDTETWDSLYTLQFALGALLCIVTFVVSPRIASWMDMPGISNVIQILSVALVLSPLSLVHLALYRKKLEFKQMGLALITASVLEWLVGLFLLYRGYGIASIAYAYVTRFAILGLWSMTVSSFTLQWGWKGLSSDRKSFALYDLGSQWINQWSTQIDRLLIGAWLGPAALGFYALAWDLLILPLSKLGGILSQTALPIYTRMIRQSQSLQSTYVWNAKWLFLLSLPWLTVLWWQPEWIVQFLYGSGWNESASLLPILVWAALIKVWAYPGGPVILSRGRANILFYWNLLWTASLSIGLFAIFVTGGELIDAVWTLVLLSFIGALIWHYLVQSIGQFRWIEWLIVVIRPLLLNVAILGILLWFDFAVMVGLVIYLLLAAIWIAKLAYNEETVSMSGGSL